MPEMNESFASRRNKSKIAPMPNKVSFKSKESIRRGEIESKASWKKLRRWFFIRNPLCCDPLNIHRPIDYDPLVYYRIPPTADVHHIVHAGLNESMALDANNLAPLCASCHRSVESRESRGQSTQHLFKNLDIKRD